jgi:acetyl-CoA acetyltransferase
LARNPLRGQVAVVGVGSTPYRRDARKTYLGLALEAAIAAIKDAGVDKSEINGIVGSGRDVFSVGDATYLAVQGALGIEKTTWVLNSWLGSCFVYAAQAVATGLCDTLLLVQAYRRGAEMSQSAANDPFRQRQAQVTGAGIWRNSDLAQRWYHNGEPYAAWMARYMHDYGVSKDIFGRIAVNNRSHASRNPNAIARTPITLDDYHASREIWTPMQLLDMDIPVDAGEALVLTTAERARDLPGKAVYLDAMSLGGTSVGEFYENGLGWGQFAPFRAMEGLWQRTDLTAADADLFYAYDGFSINALAFIEAAGFCGLGEATDLFQSSWDKEQNIVRLNGGRTLMSTNGGNMSQGRTGGAGYYSEAVRQLRGDCGDRQAAGARTALIGAGSFYHDPAAVLLTAEPR